MCCPIVYNNSMFLLQSNIMHRLYLVYGVGSHLFPQEGNNQSMVAGKKNTWRWKLAGSIRLMQTINSNLKSYAMVVDSR
jgi:hypothetical protein